MRAAANVGCLILVVAAGCASGGGAAPPGSGDLSPAEIEELFEQRTAGERMRFTDADAQFITMMIPHHAQALVMAGLVPDRTSNPAIRTLAARITNAQRDEIATMERWLRDRGLPVPDIRIEGTEVMVDGAAHHHPMPGMLTPEQMADLERARGAQFDRLFLTYMIQHHRGAVTMVEELVATDGALQGDETFRLASDIRVDQETEVARMESMLERM